MPDPNFIILEVEIPTGNIFWKIGGDRDNNKPTKLDKIQADAILAIGTSNTWVSFNKRIFKESVMNKGTAMDILDYY